MMHLEIHAGPLRRREWDMRHPLLAKMRGVVRRILGLEASGPVLETDSAAVATADWPRDWQAEASALLRQTRLEAVMQRTGLSRTHLQGIARGERVASDRTARVIVEACEEIRGRRSGR